MMVINSVRRGDVYYCQLDKKRPCVVISNNKYNISSKNVTVIPLSSSIKRLDLPSHVLLERKINDVKAMVMTEFYYSINQDKLKNYVCTLSDKDMNNISCSIKRSLSLDEL